MGYTFRTPGPWGPGSAEDLTPEQVDANFWQAIQDIAAKAAQGVGISNIVVNGDQMTIVLTDHSLLGPYTLPQATIQFRGEWLPDTAYVAGDIITHGGSTYMVEVNHTSAATFDPGANIGGNDLYGLLLQNPPITIPVGGADGAFLRKLGIVDYVSQWATAALNDLSDVSLPSLPIEGDVLVYSSGIWTASSISASGFLLSELGDVSIPPSPGPSLGQILTFNGAIWIAANPIFNPTVTTPAAGQIITYAGGQWVNSNTADIPVKPAISVFGPLTLDYSQGGVQRIVMTNGVTMNPVINWPPIGQFGRLLLEIRNSGAYTWQWPAAYHWPGGSEPTVSSAGRDIYSLTTFDGGISVDGSIIGQNYL